MAPRVAIILLIVCLFSAVAGGLITTLLTKKISTDVVFTDTRYGWQDKQVILREKPVIVFEMSKLLLNSSLHSCPAWYTSDITHVLYKVIGWKSAAEFTVNYKNEVGKPWENFRDGISFFRNAFNTYYVKFHRLGAKPVRIIFVDSNRVSDGCGYLGRIPLLPGVEERNTAIDVITDLLFLQRIKNRADLSPTFTPPRPASM